MIGRNQRFAGGGFGGDLLADCLNRILRISDQIGIAVALLDILDCGNPELRETLGSARQPDAAPACVR
jgi:hypothetical protein